MSKVVHFEIPADDTNRVKEFWSGIFGIEWQELRRAGRVLHVLERRSAVGRRP